MSNQLPVVCPICQTKCLVTPGRRCYCLVCAKKGIRSWLISGKRSNLSSMRASLAKNFGRSVKIPASGTPSGLREILSRLARVQCQIATAETRSENAAPRITYGFGSQSLSQGTSQDKRFRVIRKPKRIPREQLELLPTPYSVNAWEANDHFVVLVENVETPNWRDHSDGISISVHDDVLRIVDTRKNAPQSAVIELIIPEEYEPNLQKASSWSNEVYKKGSGLQLKFPKK